MITDEILLNNGYKKYEDRLYNADCLFHKRIKNKKGQTKYFITFYKYSHCNREDNYEVSLQFEKSKYMMNINIFGIDNTMKLEELENEVSEIWWSLDCKYYDCEVD